MPERRPRVLFLNRSYWPDGEATGQLLTELAEDLAGRFSVTVVAGLPNANPSREGFRKFRGDDRNGVRILRVPHTTFPKTWLPGRAVNFVTFLLAAVVRATLCRKQDVVVVESDPFLLAIGGVWLKLRHRARYVVYLQDIHPDVGIAIGRLSESPVTRVLRRTLVACYRRADRVVVLSEDMRRTLSAWGLAAERLVRLPNWVDTAAVRPGSATGRLRREADLADDAFLVMYSGNLGMSQRLDVLLDAAERLLGRDDIRFVFVGGGAAAAPLKAEAEKRRLENVRFLPYRPKSELGESLAAADLHVVSIDPAALPYLMPSKLYGILAAGRPVLATAVAGTELADEIVAHDVGRVVRPGDAAAMAEAISAAADDRSRLRSQGERARRLAETEYDRKIVTARFGDLLDGVLASRHARGAA